MWCLKCHALPRNVLQTCRFFNVFVLSVFPTSSRPRRCPWRIQQVQPQLTQLTQLLNESVFPPLPWQSLRGRPGRRARHRLCQWPHPPTGPGREKKTTESECYQKWTKMITLWQQYITIYYNILQYITIYYNTAKMLRLTVKIVKYCWLQPWFVNDPCLSPPWDHPHGSNVGSDLSSANSPHSPNRLQKVDQKSNAEAMTTEDVVPTKRTSHLGQAQQMSTNSRH